MRETPTLTPREIEVLRSIVEAYIETGEPVASRMISRRRKDALSPASIRNVMADLSDGGYLAQPHTSAGRVPTLRAFYVYVQSLAERELPPVETDRMRAEFDEATTMTGWMERSSHFLTEVTHNVGIAAAIPTSSQILDQIELLKLADRRVLMMVITRDRTVRERVVAVNEDLSQDELNSIRNYVNANFNGWVLIRARQELERRLRRESAACDDLLRRLAFLYGKGLLDIDLAPEIYMEGASNLVGLDLQLTRERMRELFHALEEKKRLLELLDLFLEQPAGELGVKVGLGDAHPSMNALALIGFNVLLPSGLSGKIAVLGPVRMDYGRVMAAVRQVGQAFQSLPS